MNDTSAELSYQLKRYANSYQLSAISYQLSAISYQLSAYGLGPMRRSHSVAKRAPRGLLAKAKACPTRLTTDR